MRSDHHVHQHLAERDVPHEIVRLTEPSTTASRAAQALDVPLATIVKSLVFVLDDRPALVLVAGDRMVDEQKLQDVCGCRRVRLAASDEVVRLTGFRVGTVPPCGLARQLPVIADAGVFEPPEVYCGGGTESSMVRLGSADLRRIVSAHVAHIAAGPPDEDRDARRTNHDE